MVSNDWKINPVRRQDQLLNAIPKYQQREWTAGLTQITKEIASLSGDITPLGLIAGGFYDPGELQAVIDKIDNEIIPKINSVQAQVNLLGGEAFGEVIAKLNQIIEGLTVR